MEHFTLGTLLEILKSHGLAGILLVLWWLNDRKFSTLLQRYKSDMDEQRAMYANNVELVRGYESVCKDLKSLVIMNVQSLSDMRGDINRNQFCPMLRVGKKTVQIKDEG